MNTLREAAQQAEAVLRGCLEHPDAADAIAALRAALAEPKCHCDSPGWCKQYSRCHRKMLGLPPAPKAEPVAWAMPRPDGAIIDVICPEEHDREQGQYTVPLYAAPQPRRRLSANEVLNMMPESIPADHDGALMEFARAVEAAIWSKT
jgi:hypothetical protein